MVDPHCRIQTSGSIYIIFPSYSDKNLLDGNHTLRPNAKISETLRVELIDDRKAPSVFPKKLYQPALAQDPNCMVCAFPHNHDAVNPSSERFYRPGQVGIVRQRDKWFLGAQTLSVT